MFAAIGSYNSAFALVRPSGHHAKPYQVEGFIFFNNIAIRSNTYRRVCKLKFIIITCFTDWNLNVLYNLIMNRVNKILVTEYDVHHCDGTQEVFYQYNIVPFCYVDNYLSNIY